MLANPCPRLARPFAVLLGFAALSSTAQADILTVGPGLQFTDISSAIAAAADGDTVLVSPGTYSGFRVLGKSLTVLGSGSGSTIIDTAVGNPFEGLFCIDVTGVNEGRARVGGFSVQTAGDGLLNSQPEWVSVQACKAPVEIFDIEVQHAEQEMFINVLGTELDFPLYAFFAVDDSRQVHLSDCRVNGAAELPTGIEFFASFVGSTHEGMAGLRAHDSLVWASNCHFEGSSAPACVDAKAEPLPLYFPGAGVRLFNARLVASNCSMRGGDVTASSAEYCVTPIGGFGATVQFGSLLEFYGGPNANIQGGNGIGDAVGGTGVSAVGPASVRLSSDAVLAGGLSGAGIPGASLTQVAPDLVQVINYTERRPALVPSASFADLGTTVDLALYGNANRVHVVLWNDQMAPSLVTPLIDGNLFLAPPTGQTLGIFTMDANGEANASLQIPTQPGFAGVSIAMQTVELSQPLFLPSPPVFLSSSH